MLSASLSCCGRDTHKNASGEGTLSFVTRAANESLIVQRKFYICDFYTYKDNFSNSRQKKSCALHKTIKIWSLTDLHYK